MSEATVKEITGLVFEYTLAFAEGRYQDAVNLMGDHMSVYAPHGVLQDADGRGRDALIRGYEKLHDAGARIAVRPTYLEVNPLNGNRALVTFVAQGFGVTARPAEKRFEISRRMTQIWTKNDDGWTISHSHASDLRAAEDWAPSIRGVNRAVISSQPTTVVVDVDDLMQDNAFASSALGRMGGFIGP